MATCCHFVAKIFKISTMQKLRIFKVPVETIGKFDFYNFIYRKLSHKTTSNLGNNFAQIIEIILRKLWKRYCFFIANMIYSFRGVK